MTSLDLSEWMAFYDVDPWGEQRADKRNARLASTIATLHLGQAHFDDEFMLYPIEPAAGSRQPADDADAEKRRVILQNARMNGEFDGHDDQ